MEWQGINHRHLQSFCETMATGSIRAAADRLEVEPSVISRHLQQLQGQVGVRLLERRGRGVVPTEAARILLDYCRIRRKQDEELSLLLTDTGDILRGRVRIVSGEGFMSDLMLWTLKEFGSRHREIEINLEQVGALDLVKLVAQDQADIGVAYCARPDASTDIVVSWPKPVCIIASSDHPLVRLGRPVSLIEAAHYPIAVMGSGFGLQQIVDQAALVANASFSPRLITNSLNSLREFALLKLGITFMSARSAAADIASGRLVALSTNSDVLNQAQVHLLVRAGRRHGRAVRALLRFLVTKSAVWDERRTEEDG